MAKATKRKPASPLAHYPPGLVRSWLEGWLSIPGHSKAHAVRELNEELGTRYDTSRLYQWLNGDREPDRRARNYMLQCAISRVLRNHGVPWPLLTDKQLDAIADELT